MLHLPPVDRWAQRAGEPDDFSPATPGSTTPENPGDGIASPGVVHPSELRPELCITKSKNVLPTMFAMGSHHPGPGLYFVRLITIGTQQRIAGNCLPKQAHPIKGERRSDPAPIVTPLVLL
jgi:hypothetical protein